MIKPVAHAVFGLTAYLSVVWVLVLSVPIFLLGLNQPETFNNPTIQTIASFICNFTITKTTVENPVAQGSVFSSIVHNLFLFTIFGVTHTILATVSMKVKLGNFLKQITFGVVDYDWNRSIFNFVAAAQLWFIMMYYQAVPDVIFQLPEGVKCVAYLINALGVILLLACTIQVDHLEFFGLRKALRIENDFLRILGVFLKIFTKFVLILFYFFLQTECSYHGACLKTLRKPGQFFHRHLLLRILQTPDHVVVVDDVLEFPCLHCRPSTVVGDDDWLHFDRRVLFRGA